MARKLEFFFCIIVFHFPYVRNMLMHLFPFHNFLEEQRHVWEVIPVQKVRFSHEIFCLMIYKLLLIFFFAYSVIQSLYKLWWKRGNNQ